jgi:hypothetical protein
LDETGRNLVWGSWRGLHRLGDLHLLHGITRL